MDSKVEGWKLCDPTNMRTFSWLCTFSTLSHQKNHVKVTLYVFGEHNQKKSPCISSWYFIGGHFRHPPLRFTDQVSFAANNVLYWWWPSLCGIFVMCKYWILIVMTCYFKCFSIDNFFFVFFEVDKEFEFSGKTGNFPFFYFYFFHTWGVVVFLLVGGEIGENE